MVNEEVLTGLRNAVERGESLQVAINTMINSGYNSKDVQEASKFVGGGVTPNLETKPEEHLVLPEQKGFFSRFKRKKSVPSVPKNTNKKLLSQQKIPQDVQGIKQQIGRPVHPTNINSYSQPQNKKSLSRELSQMKPPKKGHLKEIILLIILLILIGALALTILFRENILALFS